jgi:pilus assembly protein CpaC
MSSSNLRDVMRGAAVALFLTLTLSAAALAADGLENIRIAVGHIAVVPSNEDVTTVAIAEPEIADAAVGSARTVLVTAKKPGSTNLVIYVQGGRYKVYNVEVYLYNADKQVLLHCTVAEVNDQALRELGIDLAGAGHTNNPKLDGGLLGGVFNSHTMGAPISPLDPTKPVVYSEGPTDIVLKYLRNDGNLGLQATLKALETKGDIRLLANPALLATSGEKASFLSGGEFAYQIVTGVGSGAVPSIAFKEFGVRLEFTPFVQEDGSIRLQVTPEVSEPDWTRSVLGVPPLNTRRASTLVTLDPGQNLVIGGLKAEYHTKLHRKIPLLGSIPLLGALFSYSRNETTTKDLIFVVSPELVTAGTNRPALPTDKDGEE